MRPYETLIVLNNELGAEIRPLIERFETLIRSNGGTLDTSHDWGNRRLAYPIKKKHDGRYFLLEYTAAPPVVSELERTLRITDGILRYMTVQQEHTGLPQARPRDVGGREDVPLSEMRSMRRAPSRPADGSESPESSDAPEGGQGPAADSVQASAPPAEGATSEQAGEAEPSQGVKPNE